MKSSHHPIIKMYEKAWESHDLNILESIFDPEAKYYESPSRLFNGIEEIKKYWTTNSKKQKDVSFELLESCNSSDKIVFHWRCSFYHTRKHKHKVIQGIIWLTLNHRGQISSLKEYYNKSYDKGNILAVVGNPGVGKSFLASRLSEQLNGYHLIEEITESAVPERIEKNLAKRENLFETILWFRNLQLKKYQEATKMSFNGKNVIMDTTFYQNQLYIDHYINDVFTKNVLYEIGKEDIRRLSMPDFTIIMNATEKTILNNLSRREGLHKWENSAMRKYLSEMIHSSNNYIKSNIEKNCNNIVIQSMNYKFEKKEDMKSLMQLISKQIQI